MNAGERWGLYIALIALVITVLDAGYDYSLKLRGRETESDHVWEYGQAWVDSGYKFSKFPWLAVVLPFGVSFQAIGLTIHLWAGFIRHASEMKP
jgi:hypothetical protein